MIWIDLLTFLSIYRLLIVILSILKLLILSEFNRILLDRFLEGVIVLKRLLSLHLIIQFLPLHRKIILSLLFFYHLFMLLLFLLNQVFLNALEFFLYLLLSVMSYFFDHSKSVFGLLFLSDQIGSFALSGHGISLRFKILNSWIQIISRIYCAVIALFRPDSIILKSSIFEMAWLFGTVVGQLVEPHGDRIDVIIEAV